MNEDSLRKLKDLKKFEKAVLLVTSCRANQVSREGKEHGLFTEFLLEGWSGKADRNRDGEVALKELVRYVRAKVEDRSDDYQSPNYSRSRGWSWERDGEGFW